MPARLLIGDPVTRGAASYAVPYVAPHRRFKLANRCQDDGDRNGRLSRSGPPNAQWVRVRGVGSRDGEPPAKGTTVSSSTSEFADLPEFLKALDVRAYRNDVKLECSRPGKPTDKAAVESFNEHFRGVSGAALVRDLD